MSRTIVELAGQYRLGQNLVPANFTDKLPPPSGGWRFTWEQVVAGTFDPPIGFSVGQYSYHMPMLHGGAIYICSDWGILRRANLATGQWETLTGVISGISSNSGYHFSFATTNGVYFLDTAKYISSPTPMTVTMLYKWNGGSGWTLINTGGMGIRMGGYTHFVEPTSLNDSWSIGYTGYDGVNIRMYAANDTDTAIITRVTDRPGDIYTHPYYLGDGYVYMLTPNGVLQILPDGVNNVTLLPNSATPIGYEFGKFKLVWYAGQLHLAVSYGLLFKYTPAGWEQVTAAFEVGGVLDGAVHMIVLGSNVYMLSSSLATAGQIAVYDDTNGERYYTSDAAKCFNKRYPTALGGEIYALHAPAVSYNTPETTGALYKLVVEQQVV